MSYSFVLNSNPQPRQRRLTVARPLKALSLLEYLPEAGVYILSLRSSRQIKAWGGARRGTPEMSRNKSHQASETGDSYLLLASSTLRFGRSLSPASRAGMADRSSLGLRASALHPRLYSNARVRGLHYAAIFISLLFTFTACERNAGLPKPDSKEYRDLVTAFYVGLAGLQTGEDVRAKEKLTRATEIAPGEPSGWANLGLLAVRQQEFDTAFERVEKARSLAPDNSQIEALLGLIESKRGRLPEAAAHLKKAVELDPKNLRALYALAQETERQGSETSDAEAQALLGKILEAQPDNLAALLDVTRLAAKRGDGDTLKKTVAKLAEKSSSWPDEAKQQLTALQQAASGPNPRSAAPQVAFLRNVLARLPDYRQSLNAVKTPAEFVGEPFLKFIKLPSPR